MRAKRKPARDQANPALANYRAGRKLVDQHPLFSVLARKAVFQDRPTETQTAHGLVMTHSNGLLDCNVTMRASPQQWARALAHGLLHLGMQHFRGEGLTVEWNMACDCVVEGFLSDLKFGEPLSDEPLPEAVNDEQVLCRRLSAMGDKSAYSHFGTAGPGVADMVIATRQRCYYAGRPPQWDRVFAAGLTAAVRSAVSVASGQVDDLASGAKRLKTPAVAAKEWFVSSYPLLGAIAASFRVIEDQDVCRRMEITVAAISAALQEIYINPAWQLTEAELRFVMAHEFLHVALGHHDRQAWRDAQLWNVACDFVINQWLTEMGVGERPDGLLYDRQFAGLNAEAVYDRIVNDMRTYRKLATLRGVGAADFLPVPVSPNPDVDLDGFYRRALAQGLSYHVDQDRGYLPAGLVEEIRALGHPPIPWDVELARWFDQHFNPVERKRTFARPSRRQSSAPDIPRPRWVVADSALDGRTFGVVLDTSGSMDRSLLATALGAIASYAASRDVPGVRVVFCDATAHDAGYMKPEDIAGSVTVKGRGGTVLQPGVDRLIGADDFPRDAPILIITDAYCDRVVLHGREHAYLVPQGAALPFVPKGPVFRMR